MIRSTKAQIEEFKESFLWKDILDELSFWTEVANREQNLIVEEAAASNPSTASILLHLGDINGRKKAVAYMAGILDNLIEDLNSQLTDQEVSDGNE